MKFTKRLMPQDGESLSSYLFRCCKANSISFESIWPLIRLSKAGNKGRKRLVKSFDLNPYKHLDLKKTAYVTGQSEEVLEGLTYYVLIRKLSTSEMDKTKVNFESVYGRKYIKRVSRKICVECVAQGEGHKLIWNVIGVDYCEKHQSLLIDYCPHCKESFNYSNASFFEGRCPHCEKIMTAESCKNTASFLMQQNSPYYLSWKWLLTNERMPKHNHFLAGQLLGLKLMYAVQNKSFEKENLFREGGLYNFRLAIKAGKKNVSLATVFKVVALTKESLWGLNEIELTDQIIEDIMLYPRKRPTLKPLRECLAPWCPSFQTNKRMSRVTHPYWFTDRKSYDECSVCTDCYMKYGYSKEMGKWENVNGVIKRIQEIHDLKNQRASHNEIQKSIGITGEKLWEYLCYSDYYMGTQFYPMVQITPANAVQCFKEMISEGGQLRITAKKRFGWDDFEYYSALAMKEVKQFLFFDRYQYRKKTSRKKNKSKPIVIKELLEYYLIQNTEINMEEVAATLDITRGELYYYGLNKPIVLHNQKMKKDLVEKEGVRLTERAKEFIRQCAEEEQDWKKSDIYNDLSISGEDLKRKHLGVFEYIDQQYIASRQRMYENEINVLKGKAKMAVEEIRVLGNMVLTKKAVCEKIGLPYEKVLKDRPQLHSYIGLLVNMESDD